MHGFHRPVYNLGFNGFKMNEVMLKDAGHYLSSQIHHACVPPTCLSNGL